MKRLLFSTLLLFIATFTTCSRHYTLNIPLENIEKIELVGFRTNLPEAFERIAHPVFTCETEIAYFVNFFNSLTLTYTPGGMITAARRKFFVLPTIAARWIISLSTLRHCFTTTGFIG